MTDFVQIKNLKKEFTLEKKTLHILQGVDFTLAKGDFVSLTGVSGAGKSTFLHVLGTLDEPSSGEVWIDGVRTDTLEKNKLVAFRNRKLGFVFQFHHLLPELTALENVQMPLLIRRLKGNEVRERAESMLERVGLKERMNHRPGELSGGEQQRVALARALVGEPELILADEPTGNLDDATGEAIFDLLWQMHEEKNITTLFVTHHERLMRKAKKHFHLEAGQLKQI